ncbi:cell division ATPase MinD [Candidatus Woesearchaeota archaeon]|nr:cell division ATPase MinD [Candidatus Woesearchaeota archaeon]
MTKFIVVASGKGGVGKTSTAINLGTALASFGKKVLVVDANLSNPHLSILLGSPTLPITLHDVLQGRKHITEAAYVHPSGLKIIPSCISPERFDPARLPEVLVDLHGATDLVIVDSSAGFSAESVAALRSADEVIVVTSPDLPSVTSAFKTIRLAEEEGVQVLGVVVNRVTGDHFDMALENIHTLLEKPILAVIPEDPNMRKSVYLKHPIVYTHPDSQASTHFKYLAAKVLGERYVETMEKQQKDNKFHQMLKKIGLERP